MEKSLYSYTKTKMAKRIANHVNDNTPHKDRLILVGLVAILAFTVVNTVMLVTEIGLDTASAALVYHKSCSHHLSSHERFFYANFFLAFSCLYQYSKNQLF